MTQESKTTPLLEEISRTTIKLFLPKAKAQAVANGDMEWLEELHKIERKHANEQN